MKGKELRIVYLGTPDFAVFPLQRLVESGYHVVGVVTMPDKPAGRGLQLQESPVKRYALEVGLPVLQPVKLRDPEFLAELSTWKPDLGIVIAFRMLPEVMWSLPRYGTFNLHASLLPHYRGAAPINWAIMNGECETGVTTFLLNHEIDAGALLGQIRVPIQPDETAGTLHDKLMEYGADLVVESVEKIARSNGNCPMIDQNGLVSAPLKSAPKIFKENCRLDWHASAQTLSHKIRGLSPYPGAWTELTEIPRERESSHEKLQSGAKNTPGLQFTGVTLQPVSVKIFEVEVVAETIQNATPGRLRSDGRSFLEVVCGVGILRIQSLQMAGKKRMPIADFLRGFHGPIELYKFL